MQRHADRNQVCTNTRERDGQAQQSQPLHHHAIRSGQAGCGISSTAQSGADQQFELKLPAQAK